MPINQAGDMNGQRDLELILDGDQQVSRSHLADDLVFVLTY